MCWQCALALSLSVRGVRCAAVWLAGFAPLAACLAMMHVAVFRLTPNAAGRPSVTSYAYGLYARASLCDVMTSTAHCIYAIEGRSSLPLRCLGSVGSRVTTAHAHQCCIFQSYAKTVLSRMKLTMREPASMTTDTWSRRVTSDFNSAYQNSLC